MTGEVVSLEAFRAKRIIRESARELFLIRMPRLYGEDRSIEEATRRLPENSEVLYAGLGVYRNLFSRTPRQETHSYLLVDSANPWPPIDEAEVLKVDGNFEIKILGYDNAFQGRWGWLESIHLSEEPKRALQLFHELDNDILGKLESLAEFAPRLREGLSRRKNRQPVVGPLSISVSLRYRNDHLAYSPSFGYEWSNLELELG